MELISVREAQSTRECGREWGGPYAFPKTWLAWPRSATEVFPALEPGCLSQGRHPNAPEVPLGSDDLASV
jgi:hypothetical protein